MGTTDVSLKNTLEETFDIPFEVRERHEYRDPYYLIYPVNDMDELFEITLLYRQHIRLIVEIQPQKYASGMIEDMQMADSAKQRLFMRYIDNVKRRDGKIDIYINNVLHNDITSDVWKERWNTFRVRITTIPDRGADSDSEVILFSEWAKLATGMILSLLNIEKMENEDNKYLEGHVNQVLSNRYERNPVNRELCLMANGYSCCICGFDFEKTYGVIGHKFIHVHHIEKIASIGKEYFLNPEKDLIPVCPNCHAMLHRKDPPLRPDELQQILKKMTLKNKETRDGSINAD